MMVALLWAMTTFGVRALGIVCGVALVATAGASAAPATKPRPIDPRVTAPAEQLGEAYADVAAHVMPSVVRVTSENPTRKHVGGLASGMILDRKGHVLTNDHVVRDATLIQVTLSDGSRFDAQVVGSDPQTDVAVIQLIGTIPSDLPAITLGDSDALAAGDVVLAIGAPFGLTQTVTNGIVSATGRVDIGVANYEELLQTDAPLNPGNSGGPLVNMRGEVVGMNTAIASEVGQSAGINFAIPSNMIKTLLPRLVAGEKIVRGTLGIGIQDVTPDLASHFGVAAGTGALVSHVAKGSPGARAGLQRGDVILSYEGHQVHDSHQLRNLVAATAPGTSVVLAVSRDGQPVTVTATIGTLAEPRRAHRQARHGAPRPEHLGVSVVTLTPQLASHFGIDVTKGVLITEVADGSVAAHAGLEAGDVIIEVNRTPVTTADALERMLEQAKHESHVLLLIDRKGATAYVVVRW